MWLCLNQLETGWQVSIACLCVSRSRMLGDDLAGAGSNSSATNSCGSFSIAKSTNDGGNWSNTLIGKLAASTESIVLSLNLLLGMSSLLIGLVLDEEHLGLAGGRGLFDDLSLNIGTVGLLAQHINDGLVLVDSRTDLDGGLLVRALW